MSRLRPEQPLLLSPEQQGYLLPGLDNGLQGTIQGKGKLTGPHQSQLKRLAIYGAALMHGHHSVYHIELTGKELWQGQKQIVKIHRPLATIELVGHGLAPAFPQ